MTPPLGPDRASFTRREWLAGGLGAAAFLTPDARALAADPPRVPWDSGEFNSRASLDVPGTPWTVAFSPDGSLLASAGFEGNGKVGPSRVDLWETATWARRPGFEIPDIRIFRLSFAPDGKNLLAAGLDRATLITCDVETGRGRALVENPDSGGSPSPAVPTPDGKYVATSSPEGLVIWDAADWTISQAFLGTRDQGHTLAARDTPNWNFAGGWLYAMNHHGIVSGLVPRGINPAFNDLPRNVVRPNLPWWGLEQVRGVARPWSAEHLTISPDGKAAAIYAIEIEGGVSARIDLYEIVDDETWRKRMSIPLDREMANSGGLDCLAFTPDGRALVAGCSDRVVRSWEVAKGTELPPLKDFKGAIKALAFSKDGTMMAAADTQGRSVKVFSPRPAGSK